MNVTYHISGTHRFLLILMDLDLDCKWVKLHLKDQFKLSWHTSIYRRLKETFDFFFQA